MTSYIFKVTTYILAQKYIVLLVSFEYVNNVFLIIIMTKHNLSLGSFIKILEEEKIYPVVGNWKLFKVEHPKTKPDRISELEYINKIKSEVGNRSGLYCYYNDRTVCLYVGKAKQLHDRIKSHYRESFTLNDGKSSQWNKFFSEHVGTISLYWIEIDNEDLRVISERLIAMLEKPLFEQVNKKTK
ncbi:MAG: hypothetical protein NTW25_14480 [Candidatus Kapabacteria bacterium]|nr:hypothetical protein [Candidatus Kapabacteria bacterium]